MEVTESKFVTYSEAKKVLEEKEKEKELGYEQKNALEHLRKFSKIGPKKTEEMYEELSKISKLREKHIVTIINMLPEDNDDLRVLFSGELDLTSDDKAKIIGIVKKFI
ncbi:MAG: DNA-directed RNA polymerase subunit F [Candidatus Aenigmarchaeota archaeon]|nr:DNA-directed RNA polymerase subunit F [Candidatus Aenigmarchaeota archaeon]